MDYNCVFLLFGIIQLLQTYCIIFLDDSANHSTPSIRVYVKSLLKNRDIELQEIKQEDDSDGKKDMNNEVAVLAEKKDMNNNEVAVLTEKKTE